MNFIPCVTWIKRGVSKEIPDEIQLEKEDLQRILEGAAEDILDHDNIDEGEDTSEDEEDDPKEESETHDQNEDLETSDQKEDIDDVMAKYDLDNYDDAEEDALKAESLTGLKSIACFASNDDDPYMTVKRDDSDDDEEENKRIKDTDNLIAVGHIDQDMSVLEFHVYNEKEEQMYVHHDIILPAYPLCLEWLDFDPDDGGTGNFVAVGTMLSQIDVWDIDIVNCLEPSFSLGSKKKKKKKSGNKKNLDGHTDAVLSLSWNKVVRNVLASGSADYSALLWDLKTKSCVTKIKDHSEKVQTLQWHPFEAQTLLSGSCDQTVKLFDCRSCTPNAKTWNFDSEVEKVLWNHFDPYYFFVCTEAGFLNCMDVRSDVPVYSIQAHEDAVAGISLSSNCPGCLVTASADKNFKVWDILNNEPVCIAEHDFRLGEIHCASCCPDNPFVIAAGGDNKENNFVVWDIRQFDPVAKRFGNRQLLQVNTSQKEEEMDVTANIT